jgi:D-aminoacyl-tRNA deacylase
VNYAIIICEDQAGQNIKSFLHEFDVAYHEQTGKCIYAENLDKNIDADLLIFATTHRSEKGVQSLTVHFPGNWKAAALGGKEREIGIAPASLAKALYLGLKQRFDGTVTVEATHHGPYLEKPSLFIEIGSSEEQWKDPVLGKIIAETLRDVVGKEQVCETVVALGGGHYPQEINKILERTRYAVGHMCPKYALADLDKTMLQQAWERNLEKPLFFVLDWKGMGTEKERILALLDELGYPHKKTRDLLK